MAGMAAPAAPTAQQAWEFDVSGFIILPAVLTPQEVQHYRAAALAAENDELKAHPSIVDTLLELHAHPTLTVFLEQLCFEPQSYHLPEDPQPSYKLERQLARAEPAAPGAPLLGGFEASLRDGRDYAGVGRCHGVHAAWALTDAPSGSGLTLVPASHVPGLPTLEEIKVDGGNHTKQSRATA